MVLLNICAVICNINSCGTESSFVFFFPCVHFLKGTWASPLLLAPSGFGTRSVIIETYRQCLCFQTQLKHLWFQLIPYHLVYSCPWFSMAGRGGGTSRPNGAAAANKICQFKLVLLGESAVGKSSLVLRFVKGQFHEFQESTIGGKGEMKESCFFLVFFFNFVYFSETLFLGPCTGWILVVKYWNVVVFFNPLRKF